MSGTDSWHRLDVVLAVVLAAGLLAYEGVTKAGGTAGATSWTVPVAVVVCCCALVLRRRRPIAAAATFSAALAVAWLVAGTGALDGAPNMLAWVPFVIAYSVGAECGIWAGLAAVVLLTVAVQTTSSGFNPLVEMVTVGPWLAGRVVRSRRRLAAQITDRNRELEAEQALFASESVRYERARMSRDLHDIVAHCLSVIVVQAGAAQRLAARTGPASAAEALDSIIEAAADARSEIGGLVAMLDHTGPSDSEPGLDLVGELVQRANATGLTVRYRPSGAGGSLPRQTSTAAFRVVQESLTNAMRHAPGSPVDIAIRDARGTLEIEVVTTAPTGEPSGLERAGSGRGLAGLSARIEAAGGTLDAGPTDSGGWRIVAVLPGRNGFGVDAARLHT